MRQPIEDINAELLEDEASWDGAVEPLQIRDVATRRVHPKNVDHKLNAALGEGNVADRSSSDVVVQVVKDADQHVGSFAMVDSSDHFGGILTSPESLTTDNRGRAPFTENYAPKGVQTSLSMESDLVAALSRMSPGTENALPEGYSQPGASGFDYGPTIGIGPSSNYSYPYQPPPVSISRLSLTYVFDEGGEALTIYGAGFHPSATVAIGPNPGASVAWVDSGTITCTVPAYAGLSGRVSVIVRNPDGAEAASRLIYLENDMMNGFRLGLSSLSSIADQSNATDIYLHPYIHGRIALWDGSTWVLRTSETALTLALGTLTSGKNYDVFAYDSSGTITLELSAAWASDTSRTDTLARRSGTLVKDADNTRRYIGTIRTSSTTQTQDNTSQRFVWNFYNQIERVMLITDSTNTWTYVNPNSVWRAARATATNCFEYVCGDTTTLKVRGYGHAFCSVAAAGNMAAVGVGIDSTTVNSATTYGGNPNSTTLLMTIASDYMGLPSTGYHKITWLETGVGAVATYTFAGDNGSTTSQAGMMGTIKC